MIDKYLRLARPDDQKVLVDFMRNFHALSPYKTIPFDAGKVEKVFNEITTGMLVDGVILVALKDDEPIGFLAAVAAEPLFASQKIAMELGWWIEEGHRNSRASILIYRAYEEWARRIKAVAVQSAYLPGISPELDRFYERSGYTQVETSFMKVL